jgi:hypothetical protein
VSGEADPVAPRYRPEGNWRFFFVMSPHGPLTDPICTVLMRLPLK